VALGVCNQQTVLALYAMMDIALSKEGMIVLLTHNATVVGVFYSESQMVQLTDRLVRNLHLNVALGVFNQQTVLALYAMMDIALSKEGMIVLRTHNATVVGVFYSESQMVQLKDRLARSLHLMTPLSAVDPQTVSALYAMTDFVLRKNVLRTHNAKVVGVFVFGSQMVQFTDCLARNLHLIVGLGVFNQQTVSALYAMMDFAFRSDKNLCEMAAGDITQTRKLESGALLILVTHPS
jgi:hypothetical protein